MKYQFIVFQKTKTREKEREREQRKKIPNANLNVRNNTDICELLGVPSSQI